MADFANPFGMNVNRKLTNEELIQAIRLDISGELEAIYLYDAHVQATDNKAAIKVLSDIRDEEKAHVGELMTLLRILDPQEADLFLSGESEVNELMKNAAEEVVSKTPAVTPVSTIGSLIKDE
ncbi:hypothetical protein [Megasphaera sueciensis]|uniref:hypothetical protein n=1 Tax=Megasphaera sueciensis TaxID=349094 RepID=UPI003CFF7A1E